MNHTWVSHRDRYDEMLVPYDTALLEAARPAEGETVIDIGCGTGTTTLHLAELVGPDGAVLGVDVSQEVIDVARQRIGDAGVGHIASVRADDAATCAYDPAGADLIVSRFATMFFSDPVGAHRHLLAALRPEGRFASVVWQPLERNLWHALPLRAVKAHVDLRAREAPGAPGPFALGDPDELRSTLEVAGFSDISVEPVELPVRVGSDPADAIAFFDDDAGDGLRKIATPETVERIYNDLALMLAPYANGRGVAVPAAAWLTTARAGK